MSEQLDYIWKEVEADGGIGPGWKFWVCRYCEAPVTNEFGPWYDKEWDDEFGKRHGPVRDRTDRLDWRSDHKPWCIVPIHLDREGMGPR